MNIKHDFIQEYIDINDIKQYFLHYPANPDNEVMLIIHGGPGQSEAPFAYYIEPQKPDFNSVYYDQRGAGKTLRKNPTDGHDVTQSQLMDDLTKTVSYIKEKYQKEKIILYGYSWGSVLGLLYAQQHPEDLLFYLGAGQLVNFKKGEKEIFDRLKESARRCTANYRKLERLGDYPDGMTSLKEWEHAVKTITKMKRKHGMWVDSKKIQKIAMKSPVFGLLDVLAMIKAQKSSRRLMEYLLTFSAEGLTNFQVPVYFIHGSKDHQVPVTLIEEYIESITAPDKDLFLIPNAGHIINIDNPNAVISATHDIFNRYINRV